MLKGEIIIKQLLQKDSNLFRSILATQVKITINLSGKSIAIISGYITHI